MHVLLPLFLFLEYLFIFMHNILRRALFRTAVFYRNYYNNVQSFCLFALLSGRGA